MGYHDAAVCFVKGLIRFGKAKSGEAVRDVAVLLPIERRGWNRAHTSALGKELADLEVAMFLEREVLRGLPRLVVGRDENA